MHDPKERLEAESTIALKRSVQRQQKSNRQQDAWRRFQRILGPRLEKRDKRHLSDLQYLQEEEKEKVM